MRRAPVILVSVLGTLVLVLELLAISARMARAERPVLAHCHGFLTVTEGPTTYYELVCPDGAVPRDSIVDTR